MLLKVEGLTKYYASSLWGNKKTMVVDHVNFALEQGECLGLIGESGCGKSTIGRMISRLIPADAGEVWFQGNRINQCRGKELRALRRKLQIVFQYPQQAFNPKEKLIHAVREPVRNYHLAENKSQEDRLIDQMIESVGITRDQLERYPHEISGGQAQRLAIARALALQPSLLIADEVTSMLDVSVQAQVLQMLLEARQKRNMALLFISHDLDVVRAFCDRVLVMHRGKILEEGPTEEVILHPKEDDTKRLVASVL